MPEKQKDHDEICADIVERISNLGGFKVEFPVYLTCYVEQGSCYYYVSSEKKCVYDFIDQKLKAEIYCLPPVRKSMNTIVSSGQKDELYQQFKATAAKELMKEGASKIALELPKFAPKPTNAAQDLMESLRVCLKGIFTEEMRQLYRGLLDMAFYAKKINGVFYNRTMEWLDIEERQQEEEPITHAVHERLYSGFAYVKSDGSLGYYTNAVYESTLSRREEMMIKGTIVSPVLSKSYYFNDINTIGNVVSEFRSILQKYISSEFMMFVSEILDVPNVSDDQLTQALAVAEKENDLLKFNCLNYYKALWQV